MCDFSGKLTAWLDRELEQDESAKVERHVQACAECRNCVAELRRVSGAFEEYCEHVARLEERHQATRVAPVLWAAAAVILLAVIFAYPRRQAAPVVPQPSVTAAAETSPSPATLTAKMEKTPESVGTLPRGIRRQHGKDTHANKVAACCAPTKPETQPANWVADEPSVQISIPAAAMFPPGAVPDGVSFVVDLSIGADGTARQVRLQPNF